MTREEAISELLTLEFNKFPFDNTPEMCNKVVNKNNALVMAIKALEQEPKWIPVSNPQKELPKDRVLWVTIDDDKYAQDTGGYYWLGGLVVTELYWDMTEWSENIVDYVLAYMDYTEPEPYKAESEEE